MVIVAAKRTPFGTYGGKLKDHTATDLAEIASKAAILSAKVSPEKIDSVIIGNVIQVKPERNIVQCNGYWDRLMDY